MLRIIQSMQRSHQQKQRLVEAAMAAVAVAAAGGSKKQQLKRRQALAKECRGLQQMQRQVQSLTPPRDLTPAEEAAWEQLQQQVREQDRRQEPQKQPGLQTRAAAAAAAAAGGGSGAPNSDASSMTAEEWLQPQNQRTLVFWSVFAALQHFSNHRHRQYKGKMNKTKQGNFTGEPEDVAAAIKVS
jgi:hypothetical protein